MRNALRSAATVAFHQIFDVKGRPVWVNPWQVVRMYEIVLRRKSGGKVIYGTRIVFADGANHEFPINVSVLSTAFRKITGGETDTN